MEQKIVGICTRCWNEIKNSEPYYNWNNQPCCLDCGDFHLAALERAMSLIRPKHRFFIANRFEILDIRNFRIIETHHTDTYAAYRCSVLNATWDREREIHNLNVYGGG